MTENVGILGVGLHLPPQVRPNSWWPEAVVARWRERAVRIGEAMRKELAVTESPGQRKSIEASMAELDDPFRNARERRVLDEHLVASDMEAAAVREAIERAGLEPKAIDALLVHSYVPDYLATNNACTVHQKVGMREDCFTLSVEGACNSFLLPLMNAQAMIKSGQARYVVIAQSSALSRVLPYEESYSAWFGDGASAVVVGPVRKDYGLLAQSHRTDGTMQGTLVIGVRGKRWYDEGPTSIFTENQPAAHKMFTVVPELSHTVASEALAKAGMQTADVDFFACHQGTSWLRRVMQDIFGLNHARTLDTFGFAGSLIASNCPLVLGTAEREGRLMPGDAVLISSGGSGITYSAAVMRWGGA